MVDKIADVAAEPPKVSIVTCMPCAGDVNPLAAKAYFAEMSKTLIADGAAIMRLDPTPTSNLAMGFNRALCFALNLKAKGLCTHFAMLHADIQPDPFWLDILWNEMQTTGAHWIAAASPIKDCHGTTSTAIGHQDCWNPWARVTMHELHELPKTFSIDDLGDQSAQLGYHLLLNTGCMLIDLRPEYWDRVGDRGELAPHFEIRNRIVFVPGEGWQAQTETEDWMLSRILHGFGARLFCTRKVKVKHYGTLPFSSAMPWGDWLQDQAGCRAAQGLTNSAASKIEVSKIEVPNKAQTNFGRQDLTSKVSNMGEMLTFEELTRQSLVLAGKLPPNISAVLGIPRKGLLPASIIATRLHLPLGVANADNPHVMLTPGDRTPLYQVPGPVLVVDDGVGTGETMAGTVGALRSRYPQQAFLTAALTVINTTNPGVDYWASCISPMKLQEAEFLNTFSAQSFAIDLDGVICENPPVDFEDEDEGWWRKHFFKASPLYLPRLVPVKAIVTSRLEKYRAVTEEWLDRWGVKYRELVMHPASTARERDLDPLSHGIRKGEWFRQSDASLFVESHEDQARQIAAISGKLVFCVATRRLEGAAGAMYSS